MSITSRPFSFKGKCQLCGDTYEIIGHATVEECHRCSRMKIDMRALSFPEIAKIIDAAAGVPEGTYLIVNAVSRQ